MKAIALVSKGLEEVCSAEIKEIIGKASEKQDCCLIFEADDYWQICEFCYRTQAADRVLFFLHHFRSDYILKDIEKESAKIKIPEFAKKGKIRIECERQGKHDFTSVQVEEKVSSLLEKSAELDFKNPDAVIFIRIIEDNCYIGIDFAGFELNKRPYKIFLHSNSLRGTIAYALVRESGFEKNEVLLDPFSKDGMIAIEAAMFACKMPVNFYKKEKFAFKKLDLGFDSQKMLEEIDKKISRKGTGIYCYDSAFKNIDSCKKNAKIAGIEKEISFSRTELEMLDIKFSKNSVDRIATNPIMIKRPIIEKIYNEFFYQAEYILKPSGSLAVITQSKETILKHAFKYNFRLVKEKKVWTGEQKLEILVFAKEEKKEKAKEKKEPAGKELQKNPKKKSKKIDSK